LPKTCTGVHGADGISLFTAVEKQLGLKLEVQNRRPSPNPAGIETSAGAPRCVLAALCAS
jgi:hypothetical protein